MTVQLNPNAANLLANAFGASSAAYSNLISAAQTSSYFAGQLNAMAANGGTISIGAAGKGTSTTGNAVTIDSQLVPKGQATDLNPVTFASIVAHEFGHALLPKVQTNTADNPQQAMERGEINEGIAVVAEYIVGKQLTAPGGTLRINSDPFNVLTPDLNTIAQNAGINVSQVQFGSDAAFALTHTGSDAVAAAGNYYGTLHPSIAPSLTYDQYYGASWILRNCGGIDVNNVDWSKVKPDSIDWNQASDGSCTVKAGGIPLLSRSPASAGGTIDITGEISPTGQPNSLKVSTFDDEGVLESERDVFTNGTTAIKYIDTRNTHPYSELEIDEDATGKITAAKPKIDGQPSNGNNIDFSAVGQVLGSALGRALAPNNQFVQLAASTVVGAIGQKLAQTFAASLKTDGASFDFATVFATDFQITIAGAGASSVASFLVAELGTALHLDGFSGQLFNAAGGGFAGSVASQIATKMAHDGVSFAAAVGTLDFSAAAASAAYGISSLLGSYLGHELVPAQTHEGAVGGQLLGAIGSAIGISAAIGQLLGSVLDFLLPGIGSLIGTIVGTLIGDALGSHPHPAAVDLLDQAGALYGYTHSQVSASDGGDYGIPDQMAPAAVSIINAYLHAVNGLALDHSKQIQIGYVTSPDFRYISGWAPTHHYYSFVHADDAVHAAALDALQHTEAIGGDLLLKRAMRRRSSNISRGAKVRSCIRETGWRPAQGASASMACIYKRFA